MTEGAIQRYWGIFCPQHNAWLKKANGDFVFYPSPEIAGAVLETSTPRDHLFQVVEYGKQEPVDVFTLPPGSELCPG